ncbi:MAG: hypothetical protein H0U44_05335 [Flavisolibacter sp.]|nr:hypothetical protein [Flavisolibacter sp.]
MSTATINQSISLSRENTQPSTWTSFIEWCEGQENARLLWLGIALAGHGCILTPITVLAVLLAGTNLFLLMLALIAMGMSLVTNLAAKPTRITIPVFFLSILIDIAIIVSAIVLGMDIANTYI